MQTLKKDDALTRAFLEMTKKIMLLEKKSGETTNVEVKINPEKSEHLKEICSFYNVPEAVVLYAEYQIMKSSIEGFKI